VSRAASTAAPVPRVPRPIAAPVVAPPVVVTLLAVALAVLLGPAIPTGAAPAQPASGPPTVTSGVDYSPGGDGSLLLDVYDPAGGGASRPAVVLVHGGGWTSGDRTQVAPDATAFAQAGMVSFSIEYDENGPNRWRDELEDVQTAIRWVQANAATYRVDPTRIGLFGSSAGGNLVMLVATQGLGAQGAPPVRVVATWSGPSDLSTLAPTGVDATPLTGAPGTVAGAGTPAGCVGDPVCIGVIDPQAIEAYLGCPVDDCPQTYVDASPAFQVGASTPPMLLVSAQTDLVPAEQGYEMVNALSAAGVANATLLVGGVGHAESYRSTALAPTTEFLARYLIDGADARTATTTPPSTVPGSEPLPPLGADNRLPTPAPPPAVAAIVDPATFPTAPVLAGAAVVVVAGAAFAVGRHRRRRPAGP
jgi:acetyl esterase/lipase